MAAPAREEIDALDLGLPFDPLAKVKSLAGVRAEDVGQGDALVVMDGDGNDVLRIDYGGVQSSPFNGLADPVRAPKIDQLLPVPAAQTIMLSHWDHDHWASAWPGTNAVKRGHWLTPRQWTSPSAVERSVEIANIRCIPPLLETVPCRFVAANGDELWWEKLKAFRPTFQNEDCNRSGVAFSVVQKRTGKVIFLPGDAPFHLPRHYRTHAARGLTMRGLVAFHHGAGTHWTKGTRRFLKRWGRPDERQSIVYSAGAVNRDSHPVEANYTKAFPVAGFPKMEFLYTRDVRLGKPPVEIRF
ncbi:hypothetical protein [Brevundimonas lutea]|uniref:hypothetical protein n=1 Tax=Brevundimonas lutea TaxID=2293980 RepID=UPI000F02EE6B|nr:hypothetical protein [Brevundimonas lutea]